MTVEYISVELRGRTKTIGNGLNLQSPAVERLQRKFPVHRMQQGTAVMAAELRYCITGCAVPGNGKKQFETPSSYQI